MRALVAVFLAATVAAQSGSAPEALFDGRTLEGWRGDPAIWKVQDGCIVGSSVGVELKHNTFLVLDGRQPADFEFVVQVQLEGDNNSGIQYRSRELPGTPFKVGGPQCDLHPSPDYVAMLYDEQGAGIVAQHGQLRRWADDGITTLGTIATPRPVDLRQWHQLRIVAMGSLVWHELDDVPVTAWLDQRAVPNRAGVLALQVHGGATMTVRFRSPLLRTWPDEAAMRKDVPVPPAIVGLLAQAVAQRVNKLEAAARGKVGGAVPKWVWDAAPADDEELFFRHVLTLPKAPDRAELIVSADNHCRVYVNGERLGNSDEWESLLRLDAKKALRAGDNVIAVHAWNDGGPAGLLVRLEGKHEGGSFELVSDTSWQVGDDDPDGWDKAAFAADGWSAAKELGELGARSVPWSGTHGADALGVAIDPFQPQVATVATHVTYPVPVPGAPLPPRVTDAAPQFRTAWPEPVLQLLSVPRGLGSWVSLCADPQGRLYAGAQGGGLYRVTPADTVGGTSTIERVPVEVGGPHGLLWFRDALYVVQNERDAGLYRLTDGDGDGMLDQKELLQALDGRGEHGPHSVLVAPGGERLLIVAGNHTKLPKLASSRVPLNFAEDRLLPRLDDPHKYWEGHSPPGGWVCLCDADGKNWELITCGFRNPFDAAVLPNGEVVVYDADMEWDLGMPWYRPTRLLKVISGVDYGWRIGSAKWPTDYPDAPPAWQDIGPGSPTGMAVQKQYMGKFNHALALDWTFGIAYKDGGPWLMGAPLPLCDAAVVDGATYLVTGGRGLPSTLLRVPEGHDERFTRIDVFDDYAAELTAQAPAGSWKQLDFVSDYEFVKPLGSEHQARAALERQPVATWREQALAVDPAQPQLAVQGLIALARQGSPTDLQPILDALGKLPFASMRPLDRIGWLRVHALALLRQGPASAEQRAALTARLLPLFPQGDERQDQDLAELLAYLQAPGFVDKAIAQLEPLRPSPVPAWAEIATRGDVYGEQYGGVITAMAKAMPPIGQLAIADALRIVKTGWTLDQRRRYFRFLQQARQQKGGASYDGFLKRMLDAAWEACSETERRELEGDFTAARADAPKFQAVPAQGPGKDWQLADLDAVLQPGLAGADVTRGRNLFHAASCAACHYFAGEGGGRGPDLTSLGTKFDARSILEAIVAPSAVVSDQYTGQVLTLNDGRQRFGAVSKGFFGDSEVYELMAAEPDSLLERFPVQTVAKVEKSPLSPMPADLVDRLSAAELRDLLAFLLSRGAGK